MTLTVTKTASSTLRGATYLCEGSGVPGVDCLLLVVGLETLESEAERLRDSSSPPDPPLCLKKLQKNACVEN